MALHGKHLLSMDNLQQNPLRYDPQVKCVQSESDIPACRNNHVRHICHKSSNNSSPGFSKVAQVNPGISPLLTALDLPGHAPPDSRKLTRVTAVKTQETKASSFDFQFVNSTNQVRKILTSLTGNDKSGDVGDVIVVTHPDDLSRDHLVHRLKITKEGHPDLTPGKLFASDPQRVPGRSHQIYDSSVNIENKQEAPDISSLSSGKKNATEPDCSEKQTELHHSQPEPEAPPLTLVLDVRALTAAELPRYNDLLDPDSPCLYDQVTGKKRPLGQHVKLLVLAAPEQLAAEGSDDKAPGADFWRRINRPGNTWQAEEQKESASAENATKSDPAQLLSELPADASNLTRKPSLSTVTCTMTGDNYCLVGPALMTTGKSNTCRAS